MDSLYIIIPAYNESENVRRLITEWYPVIEKHPGSGNSRMVVIDDGSRDHTLEILRSLQKDRPLLQVLTKPNQGHGPAVLFGYHYAVRHGADYIFQTDSDGQTLPSEFERFWSLRKTYDVILGKRPHRKDGAFRVFVEKTLCVILRLFFGVRIPDANAPYRLMKREILEKYLPRIPADYHLPNVIMTVFFTYYREKQIFLPITFRPRQGGVNSIHLKRIFGIGWSALFDFACFRRML